MQPDTVTLPIYFELEAVKNITPRIITGFLLYVRNLVIWESLNIKIILETITLNSYQMIPLYYCTTSLSSSKSRSIRTIHTMEEKPFGQIIRTTT